MLAIALLLLLFCDTHMLCVVMACFTVSRLQIVKKEELPRFCRACACELNETCEIENNPGKPELPLLLKRYVPEFNIEVENACLCIDCVSILYIFHNFKRKCLRTEEDLRLHIRKHPQVRKVNLNYIFAPKEQTNNAIDDIKPFLEITVEPIKKKPTELSLGTVPKGTTTEAVPSQTSATATEFICEICSNVFSYKQSLLYHKRKYHGLERYQCDKCSREFASKKLYGVHLAYHQEPNNGGGYKCKICNFVYQSLHSLKLHKITKHSSDDKKPFQCEVCTKRYAERSVLTKHMRTHTGEKLFRCSKCNQFTTTVMTELEGHMREVHNTEAKTKVICSRSSCRRVFLSEKSLHAHQRNIHRNKRERYHCDQCSRVFALERAYYEHVEYHKRPNAGRFTCEQCNFVYHTYPSLKRHNIVNHASEDEKPFQCEVCSMRFVDKAVFTVHVRTHTGEKPYKCQQCTYAARNKNNLYKHVGAKH